MDVPSSWLAGLGLGMFVAAMLGYRAISDGQPIPAGLCAMAMVACIGAVPTLEFAARSLWAAVTAIGGAWLEWQRQTAPAVEPEPEDDAPVAEPVPDYAFDWFVAADRFVGAVDLCGGTIRRMVALNVTTWDGWGEMVRFLTEAGVLVSQPKIGWAPDWSMARWERERHTLTLPHRDGLPPRVAVLPNNTTKQRPTTGREGETEPGPAARMVIGAVPKGGSDGSR